MNEEIESKNSVKLEVLTLNELRNQAQKDRHLMVTFTYGI
jgi:hypothetical protein